MVVSVLIAISYFNLPSNLWFGSAIFMSAHSYQRSFMSLSSITNDELLLAVPSSKSLSTLGERAFQFAAPSL